MMARILNKADLQQVIDIREVTEVVERAFADFERGKAVLPSRTAIHVTEHDGLCLVMPGYLSESGALGVKLVTVYPGNPDRYGLPNVLGVLVLLDRKTGQTVCIMDATYLTAVRTGAACAVATRHLARQDAHSLAVIGTGAQAEAIAVAVSTVRDIREVKVYSLATQSNRELFARAVAERTCARVTVTESAERAVRDSDIVVLATSSHTPVISGSWLAPGAHVNAIGNHHPDSRELDSERVRRAIVVCDDISECMREAGDLILPMTTGEIPRDHLKLSLGKVVVGGLPDRKPHDITLFKSVGLAIQDMSAALYAYDAAIASGVGTDIEFA